MSSDSEYEDDEFVAGATSVLLGFADEKPVSQGARVGPSDNHLGGLPVWLEPSSVPDPGLTKCISCGKQMPLLVQISAPLRDTYYDRNLYVFGCKQPGCRRKEGSIRALRSIKRDPETEAKLKAEDEAEKDFANSAKINASIVTGDVFDSVGGGGGGSSSSSSFNTDSSNPFSGQADPFASPFASASTAAASSTAKSDKPAKKDIKKNGKLPVAQEEKSDRFAFPCFLLDVDTEILDAARVDMSKVQVEKSGPDEADAQGSEDNVKSAELSSNVDPAFLKFVQVVESNPDQVLRYDTPLQPLLYSSENVLGSLPENKSLELQLMPHAISVLETLEEDILGGMEWGTIFVACNKNDADLHLDEHGVGYQEEWVAVQWEEKLEDDKK